MVRHLFQTPLALAACGALLLAAGCGDQGRTQVTKENKDTGQTARGGTKTGTAADGPLYKGKPLVAWIAQLQGKDAQARRNAAQSLSGGVGGTGREPITFPQQLPEAALLVLAQAIKDNDEEVRSVATAILQRDAARALPLFIQTLKDNDASVRSNAVFALSPLLRYAQLDPEDAKAGRAALGELLLNDKVAKVRDNVAAVLVGIGQPVVPLFLNALKSPDARLRQLAVSSLGRIMPPARKAVPALAELLRDQDDDVRSQTALTLGRMGDAAGEALPALLEASKAEDNAGLAAREALKQVYSAPRSAAPALVKLLNDPEPTIRLRAASTLGLLEENDKECLTTLLELVKRHDQQIRQGALPLLARYGSAAKAAVPALIEIVRNEAEPQTRLAAINTLGSIGPDAVAAVPALKAALPDLKGAPKAPLKAGASPADFIAWQQWGPAMNLDATIRAALKKIEE